MYTTIQLVCFLSTLDTAKRIEYQNKNILAYIVSFSIDAFIMNNINKAINPEFRSKNKHINVKRDFKDSG